MWNAIYQAGTQRGYTANSEMASFSVGAIIIFVRLQTRFAEPDKWNFTKEDDWILTYAFTYTLNGQFL